MQEIATATAGHERRWGITRHVVREPHPDAAARRLTTARPAGPATVR